MLSKVVRHLYHAFFYSLAGFKVAYQQELPFRLEVCLSLLAIPLALWLGDTGTEKALLLMSWLLILCLELINSAIEAAIDRISEQHHPLSKQAKDCGSAAVLLACLNALLVWGWVLLY